MSHLFLVLNKLVDFVITTRDQEVSKDDWLAGHHFLEAASKLLDALL